MLCIHCGHICPEGSRFCPMCGKSLTEMPPEPVPDILLPPEKTDAEAPSPEETASAPAVEEAPPEEASAEETPAEEAPPAPVSEFPPLPPLPPKKGSPLPPILIMVGMILVGLVLFFATTDTASPPDCSTEIPWLQMDENGLVTFMESEYSGDWVITIPDTLNGRTVTGLADSCFACSHVVTVELPDTLETIGSGAFRGCQSLRGVFLPQGIRTIEDLRLCRVQFPGSHLHPRHRYEHRQRRFSGQRQAPVCVLLRLLPGLDVPLPRVYLPPHLHYLRRWQLSPGHGSPLTAPALVQNAHFFPGNLPQNPKVSTKIVN